MTPITELRAPDGSWCEIKREPAATGRYTVRDAFLAPLLEQHGWLGLDLVDLDGANACWLLVQHAPPDRQDEWLSLMERAVAEGTASARDLAYLRDRVAMHHGRHQTHGTQRTAYGDGRIRLWPVTDPDTLNQRRDALGLPPVDAATIADAWTPPSWPSTAITSRTRQSEYHDARDPTQ